MKTNRFIYVAAALALTVNFIACSNNDEPEEWKVENAPIGHTLIATIGGGETSTRIGMTGAPDAAVNCTWEEGDGFKLVYGWGPGQTGTIMDYSLTGPPGKSTGTFTTTNPVPTEDGTFLAFCGQGNYIDNNNELSITASTPAFTIQYSMTDEWMHLESYHCLTAIGNYTNGEIGKIDFKLMMSVLTFKITFDEVSGEIPASVELNGNIAREIKIQYGVENGALKETSRSIIDSPGSLQIAIYGATSTKSFSVHYIIPEQEGGQSIRLAVQTSEKSQYTAQFDAPDKFEAGKHYTKNVVVRRD